MRVRGVERGGDLAADVDRAVRAQPALGCAASRARSEPSMYCIARYSSPVDLAGVVDGDDVRVLRARRRSAPRA